MIHLPALSSAERMAFRQELIDNLNPLPRNFSWDFNITIITSSAGACGCLMGLATRLPKFQLIGYQADSIWGFHHWNSQWLIAENKSAILGHLIGIGPEQADALCWQGAYGKEPKEIRKWLRSLPPAISTPSITIRN